MLRCQDTPAINTEGEKKETDASVLTCWSCSTGRYHRRTFAGNTMTTCCLGSAIKKRSSTTICCSNGLPRSIEIVYVLLEIIFINYCIIIAATRVVIKSGTSLSRVVNPRASTSQVHTARTPEHPYPHVRIPTPELPHVRIRTAFLSPSLLPPFLPPLISTVRGFDSMLVSSAIRAAWMQSFLFFLSAFEHNHFYIFLIGQKITLDIRIYRTHVSLRTNSCYILPPPL
jgi:hypothetical protein